MTSWNDGGWATIRHFFTFVAFHKKRGVAILSNPFYTRYSTLTKEQSERFDTMMKNGSPFYMLNAYLMLVGDGREDSV